MSAFTQSRSLWTAIIGGESLMHLTHRRCQCSLGQLKQKFFLYCSNPEELHLVSQHFQTSKLWRRHLCFAWSRGRQEEFKWNTRKVAGQGAFQKISCFPSHLTSPLSWDDDGSIFGPTCLSILNISLFSNFFYQEAMFKTRVDVFSLHRLHRFTIIIHQKKKKNAGHLTSLFSKIDVKEKKDNNNWNSSCFKQGNS